MDFRIRAVGDEAVLAEFGTEIKDEINAKVYRMKDWIRERKIKGVGEMLPTYRSLMIYYSPDEIGYDELVKKLKKFDSSENDHNDIKKKILNVPVCYEGIYGEDLKGMSEELGMSVDEIISIHSEPSYKIYMMGFLPGFVYLGGMDERIAVPRLKSPRTKIPPRSVGIGGKQTGVYPIESPGGWRLIGSTPLDFYDPLKKNPVLCRAGEYIKFHPIDPKEYELIRNDLKDGRYKIQITEE
ncbi:5-oxoprolinase subunit PxpB [Lachnospiraceae bacterium C1.1]|nr:5-oxoprolinase subunit PxpB [Lachnospiraceae bacterium C1.1]